MAFFVWIAGCIAAFVVAGWWLGRRQVRRANRFDETGTARIPVRLKAESGPFPRSSSRGHIEVSGTTFVWAPRGGDPVDLTGDLKLKRVEFADNGGWGAEADFGDYVTLRCRTSRGDNVLIRVSLAESEVLAKVLRRGTLVHDDDASVPARSPERPNPHEFVEPPKSSRRRWPIACLVLVPLVMLIPAYLDFGGKDVEATIVSFTNDGMANVTFNDPWNGTGQATSLDVYNGEDVGDTVTVLATPWPMRGDAGQAWELWSIAGVVAAALAIAALWGLWLDRRDRRRDRKSVTELKSHTGQQVPALSVPATEAPQGTAPFSTIAAFMRDRAVDEGWPNPPVAAPAVPGDRTRPAAIAAIGRWQFAKMVFSNFVFPVFVIGLGLLILALPATGDWLAQRDGATGVTTAEVTDIDDAIPLLNAAFLTFEVNGRTIDADAPVSGGVDVGARVPVRYALADPSHVVVIGHDGTARDFAVGWIMVLIGLGLISWRIKRILPFFTINRVLEQPSRPMRYVIAHGPADELYMLLFDPISDLPSRFVLDVVEASANAIPVTGQADVHGDVRLGGRVVPEVSFVPVWPRSDLYEMDPEDIEILLDPLIGIDEDVDDAELDQPRR